jgi:hypothetical protein
MFTSVKNEQLLRIWIIRTGAGAEIWRTGKKALEVHRDK